MYNDYKLKKGNTVLVVKKLVFASCFFLMIALNR
ncbi:hypothetical protein DI53_0601 [Sphingobacterium deserti]|uniref:Uncharacterized protein n=1 Tax=Sphingobacterium deserti TaxID=1229276 RepID=A0A0B8T2H3_9SPHI|nr:hypothetical protein DI53_0601 [Sphingobacterium deserti]